MATDAAYERHVAGSRMLLDLGQLQDNFQLLLSQAHPDHISAFFYWLDLKVAQFKVFGSCLTQGNNFCSPQKQRHGGVTADNVTVNGNLYAAESTHPRSVYVSSQEQNGSHADDRLSQQAAGVVNSTDQMPSLCSLQELQMTSTQSDESNAKQVVKSLLRAMLAKPRTADISSLMELSTKTEFDSGSDDTLEQSVGGDGKDDDSQSANDAVAREDATVMESETDLPATGPNWSSSAASSPEKASRCPYCLKMFRYRSSYRRHVKIHEGIFSHECSICMRKFTRKEHFVRHKCDRRPNKPYNVTHEAFRRMSPSQKAAARHAVKSAISRDALTHLGVSRFDNEQLEVPLELTCQATGKQLDVPKLLFTGGTVSSVQPRSLDCTAYSMSSSIVSSVSGEQSLENVPVRMLDTIGHNESRRKSSTPRKVVTTAETDSNGVIDTDNSCRLNVTTTGRLANLSSVPVSVID